VVDVSFKIHSMRSLNNFYHKLSYFNTMPDHDRQTDRQTDKTLCNSTYSTYAQLCI